LCCVATKFYSDTAAWNAAFSKNAFSIVGGEIIAFFQSSAVLDEFRSVIHRDDFQLNLSWVRAAYE